MTFEHGETVILHRQMLATEPDGDGNDVYTDDPQTIEGVGVAPRDGNGTSGNENTQGRETVIIGLTLFLPAGTRVAATDRFTVRGDPYEVEGQPEAFLSPFTGLNPGLPVAVKRVTG